MNNTVRQVVITVVVVLVAFLALQSVVQSFKVQGESMEPTFESGEFLMVDKVTYHFRDPHRGDVVIFYRNPTELYIKRIIGEPGDTVSFKNGKAYIDGVLLEEDPQMRTTNGVTAEVPEGEYYVLGDNRINSRDSRQGWTITEEDIVGRVWMRYWPVGHIGFPSAYSATLE